MAFTRELNSFMESSSKVFFELTKSPMYHLTVLGHAKALLELSENFELNAITVRAGQQGGEVALIAAFGAV